jgi:hypothetical protein
MDYTVGYEHTQAVVNGERRTYTLRATQIYRRDDGGWKVDPTPGILPMPCRVIVVSALSAPMIAPASSSCKETGNRPERCQPRRS